VGEHWQYQALEGKNKQTYFPIWQEYKIHTMPVFSHLLFHISDEKNIFSHDLQQRLKV